MGLLRLRQQRKLLWPADELWTFAFEPDFLLTAEFQLFVQGKKVPSTRTYHYQSWDRPYTIVDPMSVSSNAVGFDELLAELEGVTPTDNSGLRRSSRVPSPVKPYEAGDVNAVTDSRQAGVVGRGGDGSHSGGFS